MIRITMQNGKTIDIELDPKAAPITCENFEKLVKQGFYNGLTFHRVIPGFMIQGGCPEGTGMGGPGYTFDDEIHPELQFTKKYQLAMANAGKRMGKGTNGSQFFITHVPTPWLDGKHSVFGETTGGQEVVNAIQAGDKIVSVEILEATDDLFSEMKHHLETWNKALACG